MKAYRYFLVALALGVLGAVLAWLIGRDPGLVLIERGGWRVETTIAFAVAMVIVLWLTITGLVRLARWPIRAWERRRRKRAFVRLAQGLRARLEGRLERAANQLIAASTHPEVAEPALIGAIDAMRARGDATALEGLVDRAAALPGGAALVSMLRADIDLAAGRRAEAIERLVAAEAAGDLPPAGVVTLARALVEAGRAREALPLVARLAGTRTLPTVELDALIASTITSALAQASDRIHLASLWAGLSRADRARPGVVDALAARARALGTAAEFIDEAEGVVNHAFGESAVRAWASMPGGDPERRRDRIDRWLADHPGSAALYVARARMNRWAGDWAEAEADARRALACGAGADAWEELGAAYSEQGDAPRAARAYANALAVARGEPAAPLAARLGEGDVGAVPAAEIRNEHGIPRLPDT
jgi:HemY protein